MFAFEVEFLTGVSVAASPYRREEAEWPPHPDRFFQALVAAWGRNVPPDAGERKALEWLESLDMDFLEISAPACGQRDAVTVFVPPNDPKTKGKQGTAAPKNFKQALYVIPALRKNRQPRNFPAFILPGGSSCHVSYVWHIKRVQKSEFEFHQPALSRLAREVTYLGHSHSLVRVALNDGGNVSIDGSWKSAEPSTMRLPYKNRLRELEELYVRSEQEKKAFRPNPSLVTRVFRKTGIPPAPATLFDADNVTVFTDAGGFVPTLAAFPLVAKRFRDALLACAPANEAIPALLSGHNEEGKPTGKPHLAIVPLADVGWRYSQGRLMGLAMVWPQTVSTPDRTTALRSVAAFLNENPNQRGIGLLHFGRKGSWSLALESTSALASLRHERYAHVTRRWGTVLPVGLDRHPKNKPGKELADIVVKACLNIGLPEDAVDGIEIETHKYSPVKGAPSIREVLQSLPKNSPYRAKPFVHLVLNFTQPVRGPLVLGAGRFRGLGLCLPLEGESTS